MAWAFQDNVIGRPALTAKDVATTQTIGATTVTTPPWRLGDIAAIFDPTYGSGEAIYLKGVTNNFVGALVTYVTNTGTTALSTTSGIATGGAPMAVSLTNADGTQYAWFQISGDAVLYKTNVKVDPASGSRVMLSATAGRVMQTSVAGRQILGARFASLTTVTSTTSTAIVTLNRPAQKSGSAV
jgi:predicted anti-sigma-YlaC factor YlaD